MTARRVASVLFIVVLFFLAIFFSLRTFVWTVDSNSRCGDGAYAQDATRPLFDWEPFTESLAAFSLFHQDSGIFISLVRPNQTETFTLVVQKEGKLKATQIVPSKIQQIEEALKVKRTGFVGLKLDDGKYKIPQQLRDRLGFGCCEVNTGAGYVLAKSKDLEEQAVTLGNRVDATSLRYYALSVCGAVYTVDLRPLLDAFDGL